MKHLNIKIYGKVQGVFYRQSTKEKAEELGITGFARNQPDGSVYIEAEGSPEALKKLCQWCETGPRLAKVSRVEAEEGNLHGYNSFEIRR